MMSYKDDHFVIEINKKNTRKLNIGKKKAFTISEGIMLFQIMGQNKAENLSKLTFW